MESWIPNLATHVHMQLKVRRIHPYLHRRTALIPQISQRRTPWKSWMGAAAIRGHIRRGRSAPCTAQTSPNPYKKATRDSRRMGAVYLAKSICAKSQGMYLVRKHYRLTYQFYPAAHSRSISFAASLPLSTAPAIQLSHLLLTSEPANLILPSARSKYGT